MLTRRTGSYSVSVRLSFFDRMYNIDTQGGHLPREMDASLDDHSTISMHGTVSDSTFPAYCEPITRAEEESSHDLSLSAENYSADEFSGTFDSSYEEAEAGRGFKSKQAQAGRIPRTEFENYVEDSSVSVARLGDINVTGTPPSKFTGKVSSAGEPKSAAFPRDQPQPPVAGSGKPRPSELPQRNVEANASLNTGAKATRPRFESFSSGTSFDSTKCQTIGPPPRRNSKVEPADLPHNCTRATRSKSNSKLPTTDPKGASPVSSPNTCKCQTIGPPPNKNAKVEEKETHCDDCSRNCRSRSNSASSGSGLEKSQWATIGPPPNASLSTMAIDLNTGLALNAPPPPKPQPKSSKKGPRRGRSKKSIKSATRLSGSPKLGGNKENISPSRLPQLAKAQPQNTTRFANSDQSRSLGNRNNATNESDDSILLPSKSSRFATATTKMDNAKHIPQKPVRDAAIIAMKKVNGEVRMDPPPEKQDGKEGDACDETQLSTAIPDMTNLTGIFPDCATRKDEEESGDMPEVHSKSKNLNSSALSTAESKNVHSQLKSVGIDDDEKEIFKLLAESEKKLHDSEDENQRLSIELKEVTRDRDNLRLKDEEKGTSAPVLDNGAVNRSKYNLIATSFAHLLTFLGLEEHVKALEATVKESRDDVSNEQKRSVDADQRAHKESQERISIGGKLISLEGEIHRFEKENDRHVRHAKTQEEAARNTAELLEQSVAEASKLRSDHQQMRRAYKQKTHGLKLKLQEAYTEIDRVTYEKEQADNEHFAFTERFYQYKAQFEEAQANNRQLQLREANLRTKLSRCDAALAVMRGLANELQQDNKLPESAAEPFCSTSQSVKATEHATQRESTGIPPPKKATEASPYSGSIVDDDDSSENTTQGIHRDIDFGADVTHETNYSSIAGHGVVADLRRMVAQGRLERAKLEDGRPEGDSTTPIEGPAAFKRKGNAQDPNNKAQKDTATSCNRRHSEPVIPDVALNDHADGNGAPHPTLSSEAKEVLDRLCHHDNGNCTLCSRVSAFNQKSKHTPRTGPIPVSERMQALGQNEDEPTMRPSVAPGLALERVTKALLEELAQLKMELAAIQEQYAKSDASHASKKRKNLKERVSQLLNAVESKSDQVYSLHDVLLGQEKSGQLLNEHQVEATLTNIGIGVDALKSVDNSAAVPDTDVSISWDEVIRAARHRKSAF